ncbi:MAG: hypothetical protein MUC81_07745 [Bacteroidia bacterium]|jgi:CcmD family protein|nr:hypothetical protein [Bacteroidia bacterium]
MNSLINHILLQTETVAPANNKFEVVVYVLAVIFLIIVGYLIVLDKKIKNLEDKK